MDQSREEKRPQTGEERIALPKKVAQKLLKYGKSPIFWLIFGGALLLCGALGVALALFLPMLVGNPVVNTWNAVFFETEAIQELVEGWKEDGWQSRVECDVPSELSGLLQDFYVELKGGGNEEATEIELSIGAEQSNVRVTLYYDQEIVALKGLLPDEGEYVSFPRVGLVEALDASVFHPESKTRYAMEEEEYRALLMQLRNFERLDEDVLDAEEDFAEEIVEIVYGELRPTVEYGFSKSPFGISQKMTLEVDAVCVQHVLDALIEKAEEAGLHTYVWKYEQWKDRVPAGLRLKIQSTVVGEKVTCLHVEYQSDRSLSALSAEMFFTYGSDEVEVELSLRYRLTGEEGEIEVSSEHDYTKAHADGGWRIRYSDYVTTEQKGAETLVSRTGHKVDLLYKEDGAWRMSYLVTGEEEREMTLSGVLVLDMGREELHFSIDRVERENEHTSRAILDIVIEESDKEVEKVTQHTDFFSFTGNQMRDFLRGLPLRDADQVLYEVTGTWWGSYTMEGKPLYSAEACTALMEKYITHFKAHLQSPHATERYMQIYLYDEALETYFVLWYDAATEQIGCAYAYELSEEIEAQYRRAYYYEQHGGLVFYASQQ